MTTSAPAAAQTDYAALLKEAWDKFTKADNLVPLIVGVLALALVSFTLILIPPVLLGLVRTGLKVARGQPVTFDDLWSGFKDFGSACVLALLAGVLIGIGTVLFVIPGIVLAFLFTFSFHVLADRPDVGAGGALKESIALVKGNVVDVLVFWVISGVLTGVLAFTAVGTFAAGAYLQILGSLMYLRYTRAI